MGTRSRNSIEEMDKAQSLPIGYPNAVDATYFIACDKNANYIASGIARRPNSITQAFLFIRIPKLGLLRSEHLPDTHVKSSNDQHTYFSAAGLKAEPISPMKEWKLTFSGKMDLMTADGLQLTGKKCDLVMDAKLTAESEFYDYDTDVHAKCLAKALANEEWNSKRFQDLKNAHQTHHEQFMKYEVKVVVDTEEFHFSMNGIRDHSYGKFRDWNDIHRYALQYIFIKDGSRLSLLNICLPKLFSRFVTGYYIPPHSSSSLTKCRQSIIDSTQNLWQFGENGMPTDSYAVEAYTDKGQKLLVECQVICKPTFQIGGLYTDDKKQLQQQQQRSSLIYERMCKYKINGIDGFGFSEWAYKLNNVNDL